MSILAIRKVARRTGFPLGLGAYFDWLQRPPQWLRGT